MKKITKYIVTLFLIFLTALIALSFISNKSYGMQASDNVKKYLSLYSVEGNKSRNGRPTGFYTSGMKEAQGTIPIIKIIEVNGTGGSATQKDGTKDEVIYCLNNGVGFGQGEGEGQAASSLEYVNYYDMRNTGDIKENFTDNSLFHTNDLETNAEYNELMWILDNICIPEDEESVSELFTKAGLDEETKDELEEELKDNCSTDDVDKVFKDIIECIQQTAIWSITGTKQPAENLNINVSENNGETTSTSIEEKYFGNQINTPLRKLYAYLIKTPKENQSYNYGQAESTFIFEKNEADVNYSDSGVKIGPYKITASNYSEFTARITDDNNEGLDKNKVKIVEDNGNEFQGDTVQAQIEDAISNQKKFYLQLLAGTSGNIKIDVSAKTKERKLELWTTNVNLVQTSQPVVIIDETSETKTGSDSKEVQEQKTQVKVTKQWENNDNQDVKQIKITVTLTATNDDTFKAITQKLEEPDWTCTFEDLPVYSPKGEKIKYHVEETNIPEGYTSSITRTRNGRCYYNKYL